MLFPNGLQNILFEGDAVFRLIPQRPPIVMIDKFLGLENENSFSSLTVKSDNLFCEKGVFTEAGIIEHFAQSAAARIGYIYFRKKENVPVGFIGSVNKLKIFHLPEIGCELKTIISVVQEVGKITLVRAKSWVEDCPIAEGELKIYLNTDS